MKKVITFFAFAILMSVGTQSVLAQKSKTDFNSIAAEKTEALGKQLQLNDEQQNEVFKVYQAYFQKKSGIRDMSNSSATIEKLNAFRDNKFKTILSEEQFKRYLKTKEE